jgi:hypothetical protein
MWPGAVTSSREVKMRSRAPWFSNTANAPAHRLSAPTVPERRACSAGAPAPVGTIVTSRSGSSPASRSTAFR